MTDATMEMSEAFDAIAKVFPKAQADMGEVFKTANNPAFKSKYANLSAVIEAVVPALNKHGISLLQPATFKDGHVHISTWLMHESGQWFRNTLSIPIGKTDAHSIGSAATYGRRYGLMAMSGVAPEDDDGNLAARPGDRRDHPPRQQQAAPPAESTQPAKTLAQRADMFTGALKSCETKEALVRTWKQGGKVCADLDLSDPERLVELTRLNDELMAGFDEAGPAADAAEVFS